MTECTNIDLQEQLPELLAGTLPVSDRVAVELHLASCAACHAEYALLEAVRRARPEPPAINIAAIVAALPSSPGAVASDASAHDTSAQDATSARPLRIVTGGEADRQRRAAAPAARGARGFAGSNLMRLAAVLTVVAVGGLSLSVANRNPSFITEIDGPMIAVATDSPFVVAGLMEASIPYGADADLVEPVVSVAPAVLPIQELGDYTHEELTLLLERLDEWDGAPRADSGGVTSLQRGADGGDAL